MESLAKLYFLCPRYCFLINGDHFCLFQNTIFCLNFRVPVRMLDNQVFTKRRMSSDLIINAPGNDRRNGRSWSEAGNIAFC